MMEDTLQRNTLCFVLYLKTKNLEVKCTALHRDLSYIEVWNARFFEFMPESPGDNVNWDVMSDDSTDAGQCGLYRKKRGHCSVCFLSSVIICIIYSSNNSREMWSFICLLMKSFIIKHASLQLLNVPA